MEIILSSNSSKPIYTQITEQIKAQIMDGTLRAGDPIPSMRSLAKSLHVSVITVQRAYEELQRRAEEHLSAAAEIARTGGIPLEQLIRALTIFYEEEN